MNRERSSHTHFVLRSILSLAALAWIFSTTPVKANDLQQGFQKPADAYKPHTWWHWMNGHVTRESITRDLEDMKRIGLGGFTLWNTHEGIPKGPVKYAGEQWWDLLEHTINEAERLGLDMGIFNCAGWSSTGAAFVTPDRAMQEVAWTATQVTGPGQVTVQLAIPKAALGIERDMKRDPIINRRYYMPRAHVEGWFRDIAVFAVPSIPKGQKPWYLKDWRNKAAFGKMARRFKPDVRNAPADQIIGLDQVLDISEFMDEDGELHWEASAGNWTILRMGYQPTGRNNHPASYGGRGLEIDKMSSAAMDFYWENFLDRVVKTAGDRIDDTFFGVNIDSYEVGHQNWNKDFAKSFVKARGYDMRKFLPVVTGRIVGSVEFTERILWDYRKVIGDLITENYYGRMAQRAHRAGLLFADEPYGSYGNTNDFVVAGKVDIPTCEWGPMTKANNWDVRPKPNWLPRPPIPTAGNWWTPRPLPAARNESSNPIRAASRCRGIFTWPRASTASAFTPGCMIPTTLLLDSAWAPMDRALTIAIPGGPLPGPGINT